MYAAKMSPVALITGANRGLGEALAVELGKLGYHLLLGARDASSATTTIEKVRRAGGSADVVQLDVTRADDRNAVADQLAARGIKLDVLVNNGAIYEGDATKVMEVNLHGPLALTDALVPHFAPGARVVMVSSGLGSLSAFAPAIARRFDPPPDLPGLLALVDEYLAAVRRGDARGWPSPYSVSKAAVNVAARIYAARLGDLARVNAVSPGWVRTRMGGAGAPKSIAEGVAGLVWAATLPASGPTGGFFEDGQSLAW